MTGLRLHRAARADVLVDALADVLQGSSADPMAGEIVAVPTRGVERWLSQRLSRHLGSSAGVGGDGVCANVSFPAPSRLVQAAVAAAGGYPPGEDPWAEATVVWALLEVIDESAAEPWCAALARHVTPTPGEEVSTARRMSVTRQLARLFASYDEQRPSLLQDWARGIDSDGAGADLADDLRWQATLWRRLRGRIGVDSPAERVGEACAALRADPELVNLPETVSVFGPTRLTRAQATVLGALAEHRSVHLWLPHPSAALWAKVAPLAQAGDVAPRRKADPSAAAPNHQLLASLGRDAREMQVLLASVGVTGTDEHHEAAAPPTTLLGRLQQALRADTSPLGATAEVGDRPLLADADHSLQVHACHGKARQVEVLREVLLGLLESDPTLEPRDVLVMCPDIESYAPLISATFGLGPVDGDGEKAHATHPGHRLRVRLADRSLRQTNPLLGMVARLLELATSRVTASQVLDLAAYPPVRRRFGFDDDELERIGDWITESGARWGFDAAHRTPYKMQNVRQNTWQTGLDRLLVGVAMSEQDLRWLGLALPLDDVDSGSIDLAGRFTELVHRLQDVLAALSAEQTVAEWVAALDDALASLTAVGPADAWQLAQARRELAEVADGAGQRAAQVRLTPSDVRALLADRLQGRPTRAGFRTGNLTMCSMVPMRSVPHRVICLLGLDDGVFPRVTGIDGDDVLARDPLVGERDRRSEDRQLLLDAILAAGDKLVVIYTGADERTNTPRPPAVPLGELLDVVDATVATADGRRAREHVVLRHPLQPFDARDFAADRPFSFDVAALAGARAAAAPRLEPPPFLAEPLPAVSRTARPRRIGGQITLELHTLLRFLEHPVKGFLRQRLMVATPELSEETDDALSVALEPLQMWSVGDRWLSSRLDGVEPDCAREAEWRRGTLPPGALGTRTLEAVEAIAEPLVAAAEPHVIGEPGVRDVAVPMSDGCLVVGTVPGVYGHTVLRTVYSKLAAKHRVRAWLQLLALAATYPDMPWQAVTIGRPARGSGVMCSLLVPPQGRALAELAVLVDLHARGLREPLPMPLSTAERFAQARYRGMPDSAALAAAKDTYDHDYADADHDRVWGKDAPFEVVTAQSPSADDQPHDAEEEGTRFGALACRLWLPLLSAETVTHT